MAPAGAGQRQDTFTGIFRGRGRVPAGSVYDAINALILDELLPARRGGSLFKSNAAVAAALLGLRDAQFPVGQRTMFWSSGSFYVLGGDDATPVLVTSSTIPGPWRRGVQLAGIQFIVNSTRSGSLLYAGSQKGANYSTGTITVVAGSTTVTGAGTSWLANADAGMILKDQTGIRVLGVVKSVDSNTQLTLLAPAPEARAAGSTYVLAPWLTQSHLVAAGTPTTAFYAVAGQRLVRVLDNRAYYSLPMTDTGFLGTPSTVQHVAPGADDANDFHELPRGLAVAGADSLRDTVIIFTTSGVWTIENMALDALDDFGNPQRPVQQINQDVILWGDAGIAAWAGQLVVPAIDDVYVFSLDAAPVPVSGGVRPVYRSYVEAGYQPGLATVYRGHYFLPIVDSGNALVDVLVCRLDLRDYQGNVRPGWTRWANHAAGGAYASRVGASSRTPKLLGINGTRVTDLTGCFSPAAGNKADADGTNHALQVVTQDFESGAIEHTFTGARVALELADAASDDPTFTVEYASGPRESESWTSAGSRGESDGERPETFRFARRARAVRLRITTVGPAARAVLRSAEVFFRQRGRG